MSQPQWDRSVNAWTATVQCPAFGTLNVAITTGGQAEPPSEQQLAALALIGSLPKAARKPIRKSVRMYAKSEMDPEEFADMEPDEFQIEVSNALIPYLKNVEAIYFFLHGDSDIDIEHGLACLCKGGELFRVCPTDAMYEPYECDAVQAFEQILGDQAVRLEQT